MELKRGEGTVPPLFPQISVIGDGTCRCMRWKEHIVKLCMTHLYSKKTLPLIAPLVAIFFFCFLFFGGGGGGILRLVFFLLRHRSGSRHLEWGRRDDMFFFFFFYFFLRVVVIFFFLFFGFWGCWGNDVSWRHIVSRVYG